MKMCIRLGAWTMLTLFWASNSFAQEMVGTARLVREAGFAFVPDDAACCITVNISGLAGKLGLKDKLDKIPNLFNQMVNELGISATNVERFTIVLSGTSAAPVGVKAGPQLIYIIRTLKPFNQKDVVDKVALDGKRVKYLDRTCHISQKNGKAICFVGDHHIVLASSEDGLKRCLKQAAQSSRDQKSLANFLKQAGQHDVAGWVTPPKLPECHFSLPNGITSISAAVDIADQIALKLHAQCDDADAALQIKDAMQSGIDAMVKSITEEMPPLKLRIMMDGVPPLQLEFQTAKALRQARPKFEGTTVSLSLVIAANVKDLRSEIIGLIWMPESGSIEIGGGKAPKYTPFSPFTTLSYFFGVDSDSPPVLSDSAKPESEKNEPKSMGGLTPPSGPSPKYFPPNPPFPLPREPQYQEETAGLGGQFGPREPLPMPRPASGVIQTDGIVGGKELPPAETPQRVGNIIIEGNTRTKDRVILKELNLFPGQILSDPDLPQAERNLNRRGIKATVKVDNPSDDMEYKDIRIQVTETKQPPPPAAKAPAATIKLTIVNVHKEPALLFTIDEAGKLTFKQKLTEGNATDVQTIKGRRWIAIFSEKPAGESYTVSQSDAIWLLR